MEEGVLDSLGTGSALPAPEGRTAAAARRFRSPMVGREQQLGALRNAYAGVVQHRSCRLLTVLGPAGIGKSRLVQEFTGELAGEATVLHGRCLPYGEGITYWPLTEVVREILRGEAVDGSEASAAAIAALLRGEEKARLIAGLILDTLGLGSGGSGSGTGEATSWAVRKLLEALAQRRPLVVVFDDLQWAEPTFLGLLEYLADLARDAPILLLCLARPELYESHPGWGGANFDAAPMLLEPLGGGDCRTLIANLLGRGPLPAEAERWIADASDGNALFAEELLGMLVDDGHLSWDGARWIAADGIAALPVPSTIATLLASRLDGLPGDERALLVLASVEGAIFHRSALSALAPSLPEAFIERGLATLVGRDVIRPEQSSLAGDDAYRFRHVLIRDAAYRSLPLASRAARHERLAAWIEQQAAAHLGEFEEIVGYHLEEAFRCSRELGAPGDELQVLGGRASQRLAVAGRRALARGDLPAAIGLLERAASLTPDDASRRAGLLPELGAALIAAGRLSEADWVLDEARLVASRAADRCAESHALVQLQLLRLLQVTDGGAELAAAAVARAIPVFERFGDQRGLCSAHRLEAWLHWNEARAAAAADAWEQAAAHAGNAGDEHTRAEILTWIASALYFGPTPVAEAIERCEGIRREVGGHLDAEALALRHLAGLHAMNGEFAPARSLLAASNGVLGELGLSLNAATSHNEALIEMLAGDFAAAERSLRTGFDALTEMGEQAFLSTTAAFLARAVAAQGRFDEAESLAQQSSELADDRDLLTQALWRGAQARVLASRGLPAEAEELAREAIAFAEQTDFVVYRADALADLAHILRGAGRDAEAGGPAAESLRLHVQKGNLVGAEKTRRDLGGVL